MAARGNWQDVWASPNALSLPKGERRNAKGANDSADLAGDDGAGEPDVFGVAGVAAE